MTMTTLNRKTISVRTAWAEAWVEVLDGCKDATLKSWTAHYPEDGYSTLWFSNGRAMCSANIMHDANSRNGQSVRRSVNEAVQKGMLRLSA